MKNESIPSIPALLKRFQKKEPAASGNGPALMMSQLANSMARDLINEGAFDHKTLASYCEKGDFSVSGQQFSQYFSSALTKHAIEKVKRDDSLDESVTRLGMGLSVMGLGASGQVTEEFKAALASQVEAVNNGQLKVSEQVGNTQERELTLSAKRALVKFFTTGLDEGNKIQNPRRGRWVPSSSR